MGISILYSFDTILKGVKIRSIFKPKNPQSQTQTTNKNPIFVLPGASGATDFRTWFLKTWL